MTVYTRTIAFNVASQIVSGVGAALISSLDGPVNREVVTFGSIVADDCDCGQLAVGINNVFESNSFPASDAGIGTNCPGPYIAVNMTVSILRCVPSPDDNGEGPTPAQLSLAAQEALDDAFIVRETTRCILATMYDTGMIAEFVVGTQTMTEPQGGCGGSDLDITIGFMNPCVCAVI